MSPERDFKGLKLLGLRQTGPNHAPCNGVPDGDRTRDKQNHNLLLYLLNYGHHLLNFIGGDLMSVKGPVDTRSYYR